MYSPQMAFTLLFTQDQMIQRTTLILLLDPILPLFKSGKSTKHGSRTTSPISKSLFDQDTSCRWRNAGRILFIRMRKSWHDLESELSITAQLILTTQSRALFTLLYFCISIWSWPNVSIGAQARLYVSRLRSSTKLFLDRRQLCLLTDTLLL